MRFIIILLSLIFITYSQPNDTIGYKFDVILDSINKVTDKEHAKEIKTLTTVPICGQALVSKEFALKNTSKFADLLKL